MLTIFTIPKAFEGHNGIIQRNAIESWLRLQPACEIILCADDPGVAQAAAEFGVKHLPNIARNEYGTPLLDSAFDQVKQVAVNDLLCYVNTDIMLLSEVLESIKRIQFSEFMMLGQRWDVDIREPWDFDRPDWETGLRRYVEESGVLHPMTGIDYFVFSRVGALGNLPPFAVGRPGWDNWFIYQARKLSLPVIDATKVVTAVHQNHGYDHVPDRSSKKARGPEGHNNYVLAGGPGHIYNILDATHIMTSRSVVPAFSLKHLLRRLEHIGLLGPTYKGFRRLTNKLRKLPNFVVNRVKRPSGPQFS